MVLPKSGNAFRARDATGGVWKGPDGSRGLPPKPLGVDFRGTVSGVLASLQVSQDMELTLRERRRTSWLRKLIATV